MTLKGRLGLHSARVPHADRHGLMWLERGKITVENGNLTFTTAGTDAIEAGSYEIPFQQLSNLLLGPGTVISHDALRHLARQQTGLLAIGSNGVRLYAVSMPFGPDRSDTARQQAQLWNDEEAYTDIVREMYKIRMGGSLPEYTRDINSLRGIEGKRIKQVYRRLAQKYSIKWKGRQFDRNDPESDDQINSSINHASTATYAAARIAVAITGAIPQLGFIHESSGYAFALDIADLFRSSFTLPIAFRATKQAQQQERKNIERLTRIRAGKGLKQQKIVPKMIDQIKNLLQYDDSSNNS